MRCWGEWCRGLQTGQQGSGQCLGYRRVSRDQDSAWVTDGSAGIRQGGVWAAFGSWPLLPEYRAGSGRFDSGSRQGGDVCVLLCQIGTGTLSTLQGFCMD